MSNLKKSDPEQHLWNSRGAVCRSLLLVVAGKWHTSFLQRWVSESAQQTLSHVLALREAARASHHVLVFLDHALGVRVDVASHVCVHDEGLDLLDASCSLGKLADAAHLGLAYPVGKDLAALAVVPVVVGQCIGALGEDAVAAFDHLCVKLLLVLPMADLGSLTRQRVTGRKQLTYHIGRGNRCAWKFVEAPSGVFERNLGQVDHVELVQAHGRVWQLRFGRALERVEHVASDNSHGDALAIEEGSHPVLEGLLRVALYDVDEAAGDAVDENGKVASLILKVSPALAEHLELVDAVAQGQATLGQGCRVNCLLYDVEARAASVFYYGEAAAQAYLGDHPRVKVNGHMGTRARRNGERLEEGTAALHAAVPAQVDSQYARLRLGVNMVDGPLHVAVHYRVALAAMRAGMWLLVACDLCFDVTAFVSKPAAAVIARQVEHRVRYPHSIPQTLRSTSRVMQYPGHLVSSLRFSSRARRHPSLWQLSHRFFTATKPCTPGEASAQGSSMRTSASSSRYVASRGSHPAATVSTILFRSKLGSHPGTRGASLPNVRDATFRIRRFSGMLAEVSGVPYLFRLSAAHTS